MTGNDIRCLQGFANNESSRTTHLPRQAKYDPQPQKPESQWACCNQRAPLRANDVRMIRLRTRKTNLHTPDRVPFVPRNEGSLALQHQGQHLKTIGCDVHLVVFNERCLHRLAVFEIFLDDPHIGESSSPGRDGVTIYIGAIRLDVNRVEGRVAEPLC